MVIQITAVNVSLLTSVLPVAEMLLQKLRCCPRFFRLLTSNLLYNAPLHICRWLLLLRTVMLWMSGRILHFWFCHKFVTVSQQKRLPKLKSLWKQQMQVEARETTRKHLGNMQSKVNYLKNAHLVRPSSTCCSSARDTLVQRVKKPPKEPGIKALKSPER